MLFVESKRLCQVYDSFAWLDRVGRTLHPVTHTPTDSRLDGRPTCASIAGEPALPQVLL